MHPFAGIEIRSLTPLIQDAFVLIQFLLVAMIFFFINILHHG